MSLVPDQWNHDVSSLSDDTEELKSHNFIMMALPKGQGTEKLLNSILNTI